MCWDLKVCQIVIIIIRFINGQISIESQRLCKLKVGSHDPIFASIIRQPTFLDNNWTYERRFFHEYRTLCLYWMKMNMFYFHPIRTKEPPILNFPKLDLAKYFNKMATTAVSSCCKVGMKFSKQDVFRVRHEIIGSKS